MHCESQEPNQDIKILLHELMVDHVPLALPISNRFEVGSVVLLATGCPFYHNSAPCPFNHISVVGSVLQFIVAFLTNR